ncbi:MAG: SDR family NAD(P)-dependent oxidoreductase, partial [Dehalococcoidia bacterium]|nr:SDR family NAD(P)-dependent oxidoreductase [Dehalococcoidia bacterium]
MPMRSTAAMCWRGLAARSAASSNDSSRRMSPADKRVALVSGANRGIGLQVVKELAEVGMTVVLGSRDADRGERAAGPLRAGGLDVRPHQLDVADDASVERIASFVVREFGRLDVLVNNAAIYPVGPPLGANIATARETFDINLFGPWQLTNAFAPLMVERGYGRIVNVSSGSGQLGSLDRSHSAYGLSKAALNLLTRLLADELGRSGVLVNTMSPGWVRTDMGGSYAPRSVEQGADTIA